MRGNNEEEIGKYGTPINQRNMINSFFYGFAVCSRLLAKISRVLRSKTFLLLLQSTGICVYVMKITRQSRHQQQHQKQQKNKKVGSLQARLGCDIFYDHFVYYYYLSAFDSYHL